MHGKQGEFLLVLATDPIPSAIARIGSGNHFRVPDHAEETALLATSLSFPTQSWRFT
jgi:hypothetical protein